MRKYEIIDVSEGTDINTSNKSKEWLVCHYWYFEDTGYKFELYVCNKCHDISMMDFELENMAVLNKKGVDYRCFLWNMTKNYAIIC